MLLRLKLQNFKRHEELEVSFTGGLQVIRGQNEAGKSTVFDAIAYAFYGSRALPMSLEETVTWGKPATALRVELDFTHGKETFSIYRSKNGAQLTGPGVTASGQAEVTAFVEKLFGASAQVGMATMLANQGTLKDSLNSSSMPLIERLANMQLIDELVSAVQEKLPSGNTKGIEAQLASYVESEKPELDTAVLETALELAQVNVQDLTTQLADQKQKREPAMLKRAELFEAKTAKQRVEAQRLQLAQQLAAAKDNIQWPVSEKTYDIPALTVALDNAKNAAAIAADYARFKGAVSKDYWPGSREEFVEKNNKLVERGKQLAVSCAGLREKLAATRAMLITETACGLCGKDLSDVPEVLEKNSKTTASITSYEVQLQKDEVELTQVKADLAELVRWDKLIDKVNHALPINNVEVDSTTIPATLRWVGPEVGESVDVDSARKALAEAQRHEESMTRQIAKAEAAQAQAAALQAQLDALVVPEIPMELEEAEAGFEALNREVARLSEELSAQQAHVLRVQGEINTAKAVYDGNLRAWETAQAKRAELLKLLDTYNFNNGIVKKLREARPVVAKKLWAIVNTHVSHYFSAIRGTASVVSRTEDSFVIDGKKAAAFSGSTKDALGFAIRLTLQKTFLPNVNFMLVDEPGAACDDAREAEMLGVLASCGLDQVILVTHSDLADSFAANVLTI